MSTPRTLDLAPGVRAATLHTERGPFAVLEAGDPAHPTAVLVPGFTGSKEDFIAVVRPLAEAGSHVVSIDLGGQFQTPPAPSGDYSLAGFAADILAVARAAGHGPVHLVGHSFGGLAVREAALTESSQFASVTLVASGPAALPDAQADRLRLFASVLSAQGQDVVWAAKRALEEQEGTLETVSPEIERFLTDRFMATDPGSLLAMVDVLTAEPDRVAALAATGLRTLVLVGADDDAWPPSVQADMAERLGASLVVIDHAGHSPAVDRPDETVAALTRFWQNR